ncbi:RHS repeat domain-containing protein [Emticicia sp. 17c]|uniref:RHS repeat domain-containing protein n=1 Tax=Emticicia sp. 17c TaxID=3127704 RepID=UPI00301CE916
MKKLIYAFIILFAIACKPETATPEDPVSKDCMIQRLAYDDGSTYDYKFSANNQLTEIKYMWKDDNGQPQNITMKFDYNTAGNLLKVTNTEGYIDNYLYDSNGLLTRIDFKDPDGKMYEQFTVKMDAQKRITSYTTLQDGLNVNYEYNGPNGAFSRSVVRSGNTILDEFMIKSYETDKSKKSYDMVIKGHPFDPKLFTSDLIYSVPLNLSPSGAIITSGQAYTQYDENWDKLTSKSRLYWDVNIKHTYNSNGFITKRESEEKISGQKFVDLFTYTNCN